MDDCRRDATGSDGVVIGDRPGGLSKSFSMRGATLLLKRMPLGCRMRKILPWLVVIAVSACTLVPGAVTAGPAAGGAASYTPVDNATDPGGIIGLSPGWNFISIPRALRAGNNTGAVVFSGVDTAHHAIYSYNAATRGFEQVFPSTVLRPLTGIWVFSAAGTNLSLRFEPGIVMLPQKQLYEGWNAIGSPEPFPCSAQNALLNVRDSWVKLTGFDPSVQVYEPSIFNTDPSFLNGVEPGRGYWLLMKEPAILT